MGQPKRVRREEEDWPSPEEVDLQIAQLLFEGKPPFKDWKPSRDLDQAVTVAQDLAWKRGWNFDVKWVSYAGDILIDEWEARFSCFRMEAAHRGDHRNAVESYWAKAKAPAVAVCRTILNVFDGVQEREYSVRRT